MSPGRPWISPPGGVSEVRLLIADDRVRVVSAADGTLLREVTIDADRDYQPRLHSSTMS